MGALLRIVIIISVLAMPLAAAGGPPRLRYVSSVYKDADGGSLKGPEDVACDSKSFVVADTGNDRVVFFKLEGAEVTPGAEIKLPQLGLPIRVERNSSGKIFVLDGKQHRVVRLSAEGTFEAFLEPKGLPSQQKEFIPSAIAIDKNDNIYVLDVFMQRVLVLDLSGQYLRKVSLPPSKGFYSDMAINFKGDILVIDSVKGEIFSAAEGSKDFAPVIKGLREYMNFPSSISTDKRGFIYVVDQNGGSLVVLGQDGSFQGQQLSRGWKESQLNYPTQMCINGDNGVFIADMNNNRVQVFEIVSSE
jgi:DNA-binding beta-propeller fold protein YncE